MKLRKNKILRKIGFIDRHGYINKKYVFILLSCLLLITMRGGYAILSQELNIKGKIVLRGKDYIYVKDIELDNKTMGATERFDPTIEDLDLGFDVCLDSSSDSYTYKITVHNKKNKNQIFKGIEIININDTTIDYQIAGIEVDEELEVKEYRDIYLTFTNTSELKSCIGIKFRLLFEEKEEMSCDNVMITLGSSIIDFTENNTIKLNYVVTNNSSSNISITPSTKNTYVELIASEQTVERGKTASGSLTLKYIGDETKDPIEGNILFSFTENTGCNYTETIPVKYHNIVETNVIPTEKFVEDEKTLNGMTVKSLGNGEYELNGTTTGAIYIRLTDFFDVVANNQNLYGNKEYPVTTILKAGESVKINYQEISGTHNVKQAQLVKIGLRGPTDKSMTTNCGYDLYSKEYGSGILSQDAGMATMLIQKGVTFNNYKFKISFDKINKPSPEVYRIHYDNDDFTIKLYDNYEVEISGEKKSTGALYVQLKNDYLYVSTQTNTIGENKAAHLPIFSKKDKISINYKPLSGTVTYGTNGSMSLGHMYYMDKAPSQAGAPTITNITNNLNVESTKEETLKNNLIAYILTINGPMKFNDFKFSITTEKK